MYSHFQRIPFDATGKTQKDVGSRNHFCQSQMGRNTDKCTEFLVRACNCLEGSAGNTLRHLPPHPSLACRSRGAGAALSTFTNKPDEGHSTCFGAFSALDHTGRATSLKSKTTV